MNKNFMYGIGAVKYKDFTIGYIEKNSFDLGGKKPEAAKIEAEQVPRCWSSHRVTAASPRRSM